jgi:hypothetical protein
MTLLHLADWFFLIFHAAWVVFNLTGWIWKRTRKANLFTLLLTGLSWTILGIWYGFGYCPITHWHWNILHKLGVHNLPNSYMKYLLDRLTGLNIDAGVVDFITGSTFIAAILLSVGLNTRDYLRKRKASGLVYP